MPQFYTANESEEGGDDREAEEEVDVPENAIWDLSARWNKKYLLFPSDDFLVISRSNKNSPKQEIGTAPNTSERHEEKMHLSNDKEEETIPVYRASIKDKVVDVIGEEKVWATMGEMAPGCPLAHNRAVKIEEGFVNREAIDKILVEEETKIEESEKPSGCPYSHKDL